MKYFFITIAKVYGFWEKTHDLMFLWFSYQLPKWPILDTSKLKEFADDNFNFDENGRKFSKRIENTMGKGEIACYEQFVLFPKCFQKACTVDT